MPEQCRAANGKTQGAADLLREYGGLDTILAALRFPSQAEALPLYRFRKGADGLVALVRETLGHDPFSGTIFVFRAKRSDRIKIVAWDGSGLVLFWKRLEHGVFRWPPITDGVMKLSSAQLAALFDHLY